MEIAGEHIDKKHVLYFGGAIASIVALLWLIRRNQSAASSAGFGQPVRSSGGGAGAVGPSAAEVQAATALAVEQNRTQLAREQIASAEAIAAGQQYTARYIASTQASGAARTAMTAGMGPGLGAAAATGTKGLFDLLKEIFTPTSTPTVGGGLEQYGPPLPPGYEYPDGNLLDVGVNPGQIYSEPIGPGMPSDFVPGDTGGYATSTGGGSSDWFGGGDVPGGGI